MIIQSEAIVRFDGSCDGARARLWRRGSELGDHEVRHAQHMHGFGLGVYLYYYEGWNLISWMRQPSLTFGGWERLLIWALLALFESNQIKQLYSFVVMLSTLRGSWQ
jgi:hypothetical protein